MCRLLQKTMHISMQSSKNNLHAAITMGNYCRCVQCNLHRKVQFDLPFQYNGQLISTSFKYNYSDKAHVNFGKRWLPVFMARGGGFSKGYNSPIYFLNKRTYYTISSLIEATASLFLHGQEPMIQISTCVGSRHYS
jgi:hypothetical protein